MTHKVTLIPGDGIGAEITGAVVRIIEASGVEIEWESFIAGAEALSRYGDPLPEPVLESIKRNRIALKGPLTTPVGTGFTSVNVRLRKTLDLYANLRPVRNLPGLVTPFGDLDLVVVRENTEDLYSGIEHVVVPGVVESLKIITEKASTRIARFAFEHARRENRKKVTAIHKANIMKLSDGLFLDCFRKVAAEYPDIAADDKIVDNACMQLVMKPQQFDVLLLENLYGDIISDLAAGLVGGLGVVPGANIGEFGAVFEAVHGSAPDIAGKNIANPTALLQTSVMMLRHLGERSAADLIERAMIHTLADKQVRTRDLGGTASTTEYTEAVVASMRELSQAEGR
ncbi:MAG: Isocitrate dehydrogenase [NADP] [Acidobacteria bacterium]|nr:Isocitrate dehydrogenase [NADP] [Acidobacteriota bacterium]